jgi:CBS domain-containing protein
MLTARDIMTREVITVQEDMTVETLGRILIEKRISGAPVLDSKGRIVGIVTENDLVRKNSRLHIPTVVRIFDAFVPLGGTDRVEDEIRRISASKVSEICSRTVVTVAPDATLQDISSLMFEKGVHLIPVVDADLIVGIIGKIDIIRGMFGEASEQKPG